MITIGQPAQVAGLRVLLQESDATEHRDPDDLFAVAVISFDSEWGWVGVIAGTIRNQSEWEAP